MINQEECSQEKIANQDFLQLRKGMFLFGCSAFYRYNYSAKTEVEIVIIYS